MAQTYADVFPDNPTYERYLPVRLSTGSAFYTAGAAASPTTIGHGIKTVTSAGTDVALAGSTSCSSVIIQAQTDNTGKIAVGAAGVDATIATGTGALLLNGDSVEIAIDNLSKIFIDATVSGDGVRYTYVV